MIKFNSIEEFLDSLINSKTIKGFYPIEIFKQVEDITIKQCIDVCDKYVKSGLIIEAYEIKCPDCSHILNTYDYYGEIPITQDCHYCGKLNIKRTDNVVIFYKTVRKENTNG